jgi:hypothetical protein
MTVAVRLQSFTRQAFVIQAAPQLDGFHVVGHEE